jgi:hypothetical protein
MCSLVTSKRTKAERNDLYAQSLASNVLATVREALAVAPGLAKVSVLTVCKGDSMSGTPMVTALCAVAFDRALVERIGWSRGGRTAELAPLDLTGEPEIALVRRWHAPSCPIVTSHGGQPPNGLGDDRLAVDYNKGGNRIP